MVSTGIKNAGRAGGKIFVVRKKNKHFEWYETKVYKKMIMMIQKRGII